MNLQGTQTIKNLLKSFAGECQACCRYMYYSSKAKKEGFHQISAAFAEISNQEREHAKLFLKMIDDNEDGVFMKIAPKKIASTGDNLTKSIEGERAECDEIYPEMIYTASKEGFENIAKTISFIVEAERNHLNRFAKFLDSINRGEIFKALKSEKWHCRNCGYVHLGEECLESCPACLHPKGYFEILRM